MQKVSVPAPPRYKRELNQFLEFKVEDILEGLQLEAHKKKLLEILTGHCNIGEEKILVMKVSEILNYIRWDSTYRNFKTLVELERDNKVERG